MLNKVQIKRLQPNQRILGLVINGFLVLVLGITIVLLRVIQTPLSGQVKLTAGEVATQDVIAPRRITYESAVLTWKARERAAQSVPDYYDPPQSRIRRIQVNRAREVLDYIDSLRSDSTLEPGRQIDALMSLEDLSLTTSVAQAILTLDPADWQLVKQEVPLVLDQIMREEIRETSLPQARRRASAQISPDLDEPAATVASALVQALIRPNSFFNPERTNQQRDEAREAVPVQSVTLEQGEVILRAGDIVTPEDVEALEQMGLAQAQWSWWSVFQSALIAFGLLALVGGAIHRMRPQTQYNRRETAFLVLMILVGTVVAKLMIVPHGWLPFLFPLAAFGMLVALLLDVQIAVIILLYFMFVIADLSHGDVHLIFYAGVGSLLCAFVLGKAERLTAFLWAASALIVSNVAITAAFWSEPFAAIAARTVLESVTIGFLNGVLAVSIALIGYFVMGNLFGITTNLQLMELSRPTHPLLRQLLLKAPGTYHHTILVSNLAERAAEAIGADAFLIRVGAYYHDIGKIVRPYFFAENITDGDGSPHAGLDPKTSAQIIISHVKDGIDLARKYRLPRTIQDFIRQHHGAQVMTYFYHRALEQDGESVDLEDFRYPGPDPQTKEAAIMMLADTCEAAVRAERPASRKDLEEMIDHLISQRVTEGALDASPLTFHELQVVKRVFVQVLQGVHHPRVRYPAGVGERSDAADKLEIESTDTMTTSAGASPTVNGRAAVQTGGEAPQNKLAVSSEADVASPPR